jgi:maltose O-acetyltransferase
MAMSEKARMLAGEWYRPADPELLAEQRRAQELLQRLHSALDSDERRAVLTCLLGSLGLGAVVRPGFRCGYGYNIALGHNAFVDFDCVFLDCARISIGDGAQLGPRVQLYTVTHPVASEPRRAGLERARPIELGDNVWLGGGTIVLPGVRIGADTVVGAGSVVTRDLPAGVVAMGSPCRIVRGAEREAELQATRA